MSSVRINQMQIPQYGFLSLLMFTFVPAVPILVVKGAVTPLQALGGGIAIGVYFLLEAVILLASLIIFAGREREFSWSSAVPYRAHLHPLLFITLLIAVTAYAIYFRDVFRWKPLMDWAVYLQESLSFWPPAWLKGPGFGVTYEPDAPLAAKLGYLAFGMVTIGTASAMQTLYFRGFMLPRMEYLGWTAPIINTVLFCAFHLSSPAFWHLFFIFTLAWGVVAYAYRNIWIVVISHVVFNTYSDIWTIATELAAA